MSKNQTENANALKGFNKTLGEITKIMLKCTQNKDDKDIIKGIDKKILAAKQNISPDFILKESQKIFQNDTNYGNIVKRNEQFFLNDEFIKQTSDKTKGEFDEILSLVRKTYKNMSKEEKNDIYKLVIDLMTYALSYEL